MRLKRLDVRAQEAEHLPRGNLEILVPDRPHPAVPLPQTIGTNLRYR